MVLHCLCDNAVWETEPDMSNCTHQWVDELRSAINRGDSAENITEQWSSMLRQTVENMYTLLYTVRVITC